MLACSPGPKIREHLYVGSQSRFANQVPRYSKVVLDRLHHQERDNPSSMHCGLVDSKSTKVERSGLGNIMSNLGRSIELLRQEPCTSSNGKRRCRA